MGIEDRVRERLQGEPAERARRERLLADVLRAFALGGPTAVRAELDGRLEKLQGELDRKLAELKKKL
jgi:hypothetical protein